MCMAKTVPIMNEHPAWELVTGNQQYIKDRGNLFRPINWVVRAALSLMWFFFCGSTFRIQYNTGDVVIMRWKSFSYKPIMVFAYNNISAGESWFCIERPYKVPTL